MVIPKTPRSIMNGSGASEHSFLVLCFTRSASHFPLFSIMPLVGFLYIGLVVLRNIPAISNLLKIFHTGR